MSCNFRTRTSNLATGLVTANAESDPVVALAGAVPRTDRLKRTHQSMDNAALFEPITKYSVEVEHPDNVPEALSNAFRSATSTNPGATFSKSSARRYDCGNDSRVYRCAF